jgi:hypothetical protein
MKRALLSGGTFAVAAMIAVPAMAADADVTSGLQLKISGFLAFNAALLLSPGQDGVSRDYDFNSSGRLQFDFKNVTDSGLQYGARIRMAAINRAQDVLIDREYAYVRGSFGTFAFGDQPQTAGDFGYIFAPDRGRDEGTRHPVNNIDGTYNSYGGGDFLSMDPTYHSGLNKSTSIKYASPAFSGFTFGVGFTPVVGQTAQTGGGPTGRQDLFDSGQVYENAISLGLSYGTLFDDTNARIRGSATSANGISGHYDLATYSLGGEVTSGGFDFSLDWIGTPSGFGSGQTDRDFNTIVAGFAYRRESLELDLGYGYTWADKNNDLGQPAASGKDLKDNHVVGFTVNYSLAPGLKAFSEVIYEIQNFRKNDAYVKDGNSWEQTTLVTGLWVMF